MVALMVRRNPVRALTVRPWSILDEAEEMLRDFWGRPMWVSRTDFPVDMYEDKEVLVIRAELPGVHKEDIDISLEGEFLTIKAEKKEEKLEGITTYTCERCYGTLSRSISLPFPVTTGKVPATFENGLLEIRLPKAKEAKSKHILIQ